MNYKPKQSAPVALSNAVYSHTHAAISASDCAYGNLYVSFPGSSGQGVVPGAVPCCYTYPNCRPCSRPDSYWNGLAGQFYPQQCGSNNEKGCTVNPQC